jgi:hypothetical protein
VSIDDGELVFKFEDDNNISGLSLTPHLVNSLITLQTFPFTKSYVTSMVNLDPKFEITKP